MPALNLCRRTTTGARRACGLLRRPLSVHMDSDWGQFFTKPRHHHQQQYRTIIWNTHADVQGAFGSYKEQYEKSIKDPETFWKAAADNLEWFQKPSTILDYDPVRNPHFPRWYTDGRINMSYECLDVHVKQGRGQQDALIYDSPVTGAKERFTYQELLGQVSTLAGAMQDLGVEAGDRVVVYMPMVPQAIVTMLACSRIGAIHSVVFGGFASKELAARITDCTPKLIVTASAGVEPSHIVPYKPLLDEALELSSHKVQNTIVLQRRNVKGADLAAMGPTDLDYDDLMGRSRPIDAVPLPSTHSHNILYTSGTTGAPKGVVRDTGGYATSLKHSMGSFYNTQPGEVMWAASDIGWIVGHSYIVYAPLLNGSTTILYEGKPVGTPDAGAYWRVMEEYQVSTFFTAPTAFRAIKQADPAAEMVGKYDLSYLKQVFLAGEHCDPATLQYCEKALSKYGQVSQAIDHWWQTELGGPAVGNSIGLGRIPLRHGGCAGPVAGYDVHILDEAGHDVGMDQLGDMVLKLPLPPGTLKTLYGNDERFINAYLTHFPGYYDTSDAAFRDEDGYIHVVGRMDDVINVAGHRLSTGAMEETLMEHPDVADCAVFPVHNELKGEIPVGLVVLNKGSTIETEVLYKELVRLVRREIGPVAAFKKVAVVEALPKTRSGKILRGTMSKIANGKEYVVTPTIENPMVFDELVPKIHKLMEE